MIGRIIKKNLALYYSRRLNDKGLFFLHRGDLRKAEASFRLAIYKNPSNAAATSNLGALLMVFHKYDQAMKLLLQAVHINEEDPDILINLGNAYHLGGRVDLAIDCYQRAFRKSPGHRQAGLNILRPLLEVCDWVEIEKYFNFVRNMYLKDGVQAYDLIMPFNSIFLPFNRLEILEIAARFADKKISTRKRIEFRSNKPSRQRVRVAYLSSDFHDHPTAHLTLGIYALHDREKFEIYAYSMGAADNGPYRLKIMHDCDHFKDVHLLSDCDIAKKIEVDEIDILIDLKGYTGGARPGVLALRPALTQVNYLGYPGTLGADFVDFLIADSIVIPLDHSAEYSEKIIRLPCTYQPTDSLQEIGALPISKTSVGLPEKGFVFCCFNTSAKIDRASFRVWMKILTDVPGSVLWLLEAPAMAKINLAKAASDLGVDSTRILYAPILPKARHLARMCMADLALDTFVCNAHTTATDALWAGVPLLTKTGETFASRVATSVLHAVGLPQLAVKTEICYARLAVELALNADRLGILRAALKNCAQTPLFDTPRYVRELEVAYLQMHDQRFRLLQERRINRINRIN